MYSPLLLSSQQPRCKAFLVYQQKLYHQRQNKNEIPLEGSLQMSLPVYLLLMPHLERENWLCHLMQDIFWSIGWIYFIYLKPILKSPAAKSEELNRGFLVRETKTRNPSHLIWRLIVKASMFWEFDRGHERRRWNCGRENLRGKPVTSVLLHTKHW